MSWVHFEISCKGISVQSKGQRSLDNEIKTLKNIFSGPENSKETRLKGFIN